MNFTTGIVLSLFLTALAGAAYAASADTAPTQDAAGSVSKPMPLWNQTPPGEKGGIGEEKDTSPVDANGKRKDDIIRLGNVSQPTITVYRPAREKETGAAVLVCPGGGYTILAMNLEGTEVCQWLNSIGVTSILLKYRVPVRPGVERFLPPLQDAQRALSLIRQHAAEWGVDPKRLGILGFSAGGHLAAVASTQYETRAYPTADDTDKENCRPDFSILIYPAYLTAKDDLSRLAPEIKVTANTPPAFLVMTEDDPIHVENVYVYALALKKEKIPVEVHTYATGGHGYGLRPTKQSVTGWSALAAHWMDSHGWLKKPGT